MAQIGFSKVVSDFLKSGVSYPFAKKYGGKIINLASNESPFPPSPRVLSAVRKVLKNLNSYPDPWAIDLREKIADYTRLGGENVVLGNGSDELVDLICRLFLNPGDRVLIPIPTFSFYELSSRLAGAKIEFWALPDFQWRAEEFLRVAKKNRMIFVCRPNNPTGNSVAEEAVLELLSKGKIVVVDEAYHEFAGYTLAPYVKDYENLIVLRTFSKAFGLAGLRIGYALASPRIIETIQRIKQPFSVNSLALVAALAALDDIPYMRRVVGTIIKERQKVADELTSINLKVLNSDANFLMVGGFPKDADEICTALEKRGILIRNLAGVRGAGKGWVRITIGTEEQNRKLLSVLREILK
jgi:histidinol-phosphate aminotransferase